MLSVGEGLLSGSQSSDLVLSFMEQMTHHPDTHTPGGEVPRAMTGCPELFILSPRLSWDQRLVTEGRGTWTFSGVKLTGP